METPANILQSYVHRCNCTLTTLTIVDLSQSCGDSIGTTDFTCCRPCAQNGMSFCSAITVIMYVYSVQCPHPFYINDPTPHCPRPLLLIVSAPSTSLFPAHLFILVPSSSHCIIVSGGLLTSTPSYWPCVWHELWSKDLFAACRHQLKSFLWV